MHPLAEPCGGDRMERNVFYVGVKKNDYRDC